MARILHKYKDENRDKDKNEDKAKITRHNQYMEQLYLLGYTMNKVMSSFVFIRVHVLNRNKYFLTARHSFNASPSKRHASLSSFFILILHNCGELLLNNTHRFILGYIM